MKRILTGIGATLLATAVHAQQSFGLQNHPSTRQLKESMEFQFIWNSRFQTILLILIGGIILTWGVYLFTVYRMYREKEAVDRTGTGSFVPPTSPQYDFSRATHILRGQMQAPSLSMVSHAQQRPGEPGHREESDTTQRGTIDD